MKRNLLLALAFSLIVGTSAFAVEGRSGEMKALTQEAKENRQEAEEEIKEERTAVQADIKARRDALQKLMKEKRDALKLEIDKIKKERATIRKGFVEQKLRQVVKVIEERQGKIKGTIDQLKANGVNTAAAEKHLADSRASLQSAVENLGKMAAVTVSDNDKPKLEEARKYAKAAEADLKASREHLLLSIKALKEATDTNNDAEKSESNASVSGSTTSTAPEAN